MNRCTDPTAKPSWLQQLFQPKTTLAWVPTVRRWTGFVAAVCLGLGSIDGLLISPPDYQQGELVRIMYVHVPTAWWALALYGLMALMSAVYILGRLPLAGAWAQAMAPVGFGMCALSVITGAIWGQPAWGTWWVWDARLTSMLVLLVLYAGYSSLVRPGPMAYRTHRMASILAMVGAINLPIIKFSVNWWHTLHQPPSIWRWGAPTIEMSMLRPLGIMALGMGAFTLWLILWRLPVVWAQQRRWVPGE